MRTDSATSVSSILSGKTLTVVVLAICLSVSALAQSDDNESDGTWMGLTGTVTSTESDSFELDYGKGRVTVEMGHWNTLGEVFPVVGGDKVSVYGEADNGLHQSRRIEADSIYVDDLNSYFYASSADKDEFGEWMVDVDAAEGHVTYTGTVTSIEPLANTLTIDAGAMELTVDTSALADDPLHENALEQIDLGDRVRFEAVVDRDFIGDQDFLAKSVTRLTD